MKLLLKTACAFALISSQANAACHIDTIENSATEARDIGGFQIGADIRDIHKISPVTHWAFDTYKTNRDGIEYEFDVTPLGRVYAIESNQPLGQFEESQAFAEIFIAKLANKYGQPTLASPDISSAQWDLFQNVKGPSGVAINQSVNWMLASLLDGEAGKKLQIRMIDFRLLWQDQHKLNCEPAQKAQDKIAF